MEEIKILIVDDEEEILKLLKRYFEFENKYNIEFISEPDKVIEKVKKEKIDILITDVMMPDIDGIELLKQVKK